MNIPYVLKLQSPEYPQKTNLVFMIQSYVFDIGSKNPSESQFSSTVYTEVLCTC